MIYAHQLNILLPVSSCSFMEGSTERSRTPPASVKGERLHALELKCRGETMSEEQEALAVWCQEQGVPFACSDA